MRIFEFRDRLVSEYSEYVKSFIEIRDSRIREHVEALLRDGLLWPQPLIQMNPSFQPGRWIDELVEEGVLHRTCARVFRRDKDRPETKGEGRRLRLHRHQEDAVRIARTGESYVLTTGTASGKSLSYIVPIVDFVLRTGSGKGIKAVVVYPMNALANSQERELKKFVSEGFAGGIGPVTFARYTGQESDEDRQRICQNPPDILLTNFVMLELILTRPYEEKLVQAMRGLRFLVLDELHTYRGRQGSDVALLVRRVRDRAEAPNLQCVGTSATLAGAGTLDEQRRQVATVASLLFGGTVLPENVIGETLRRATPLRDFGNPAVVSQIGAAASGGAGFSPRSYGEFLEHPLASWIESTFGLTEEPETGRLVRVSTPRSILGDGGAAVELAALTGVEVSRCAEAIRTALLTGYTLRNPDTGDPAFAFRLHQFISRGDTVYASLEPEAERYVTVYGQKFVPNDRERILLPLVFCRECGQEYYCVRRREKRDTGGSFFEPREPSDRLNEDDSKAGFLHASSSNPWPDDESEWFDRLPEDWVEEKPTGKRVRSHRKPLLPMPVRVRPDGTLEPGGTEGLKAHFIPAPFRFCLQCAVAYGQRQISDFGKIGALGSEGRSTATTVLSLLALSGIRREGTLSERARKLLSFTDNRQDASLQAGHFNDFIEIGVLRAGLYRAVHDAGPGGIEHQDLTHRVFMALGLPFTAYAKDPDVKFLARTDTERAFRDVLGYRIYRDLKRGWRVTSPNLEQCGLLEIHYKSLPDLATDEPTWTSSSPLLVALPPEKRLQVLKTLLDFMRRELAIRVEFLEPHRQDSVRQLSNQRLCDPWAIDESDRLEQSRILFPRPAEESDTRDNVFLSPRGGVGQFLARPSVLGDSWKRLPSEQKRRLIVDLLEGLRVAGIVERVLDPRGPDDVGGYQLNAAAMVWVVGDGMRAFHDPIRVPRLPAEGGKTNPFFLHFYRTVALGVHDLRAREHTAQVPAEEREKREAEFAAARLPILYCSPTMELGVDISELNVVNLRNVPPTPANYAQRSGRAGRSGQPALVFSYCAAGSPHDQYFFRRPEQMVAGAVAPPRLDLRNEDLVRAHVHAIWLAETGLALGKSLREVLDLAGDTPSLELLPSVRSSVENLHARARARSRSQSVLATLQEDLRLSGWFTDEWLDRELAKVAERFDKACERWRGLYRSALAQAKAQNQIIQDASASPEARRQAERLRGEAESQLKLLIDVEKISQSDFYSYRYFASEGFLPGYNFPRLPLSAYIPGRKTRQGDEFLSRPRFLAISEFGPRSIIYHEGSRYVINKVILPVREDAGLTHEAKVCEDCGYLHFGSKTGADLCERCGHQLPAELRGLLRLQNVSTKRRDRINSDEEERLRLGYELKTAVRFSDFGEHQTRKGTVRGMDGDRIATLTYGQAATLWRINLGWVRRKERNNYGFRLDVDRGYWAKNEDIDPSDPEDPMSPRTETVIPYVEDRRNCLIVEFERPLDAGVLASMQAALKNAIQIQYQLEENELAAEPLPSWKERKQILLYESAEGGAGVLRRLVDEPQALAEVARRALEICHFDPITGADRLRAPRAKEDCEAACYDCLLSYSNQPDHSHLDRKPLQPLFLSLATTIVETSITGLSRSEHLRALRQAAGSDLERRWLDWLETRQLRLPTRSQVLIPDAGTRPDFLYDDQQVAVYVDGPPHDDADRQRRDEKQAKILKFSLGWNVVRFGHDADWKAIVSAYPGVFGTPVELPLAAPAPTESGFDSDLFPDSWLPILREALARGVTVLPGEDTTRDGRVVGTTIARLMHSGRSVDLVEQGRPGSDDVAAVLTASGRTVLTLSPRPDALSLIVKRLEVKE